MQFSFSLPSTPNLRPQNSFHIKLYEMELIQVSNVRKNNQDLLNTVANFFLTEQGLTIASNKCTNILFYSGNRQILV